MQLEKGESGTVHVQACIGWADVRAQSAIRKVFGKEAHAKPAGTPTNVWNYCGKEETRVEGPV